MPYRKSDGTAIGDAAWGTYFAAHGFAFARVDLRGSGDSSGILEDEYTEQEQLDVERVIAWLAERPWCTGAVGMIGVSWGGFAALQMAARHPEQLRGVVPIHASDDRYADDVHYIGGCVSAMDMSQWATSMLAYLNQPPDPLAVGDGVAARLARAAERREAVHRAVADAISAATRTGSRASACEDYGAIRCPVFAVGGWSDGYRDMVFRIVENVRGPVRGLIGPWGHTSPEDGAPGPGDRLSPGVRAVLRRQPRRSRERVLRRATADQLHAGAGRAGRLVCRAAGPMGGRSDPGPRRRSTAWTHVVGRRVAHEPASDRAEAAATPEPARPAGARASTAASGAVTAAPRTSALDQRPDDGASLCWDSDASGRACRAARARARRQLELSVDRPWALVAVRVCDVAPDGASTLIARGLLNLSRREGHDRTVPMPCGRVGARTGAAAVDGIRDPGRTPDPARGLQHVLADGLAVAGAEPR